MCACGKTLRGIRRSDSGSNGVATSSRNAFLHFEMFCNVVRLVFPITIKKKAIHKKLNYPQSLAENTIKYLSGSWRSSYFLSFEAKEKIAKEKACKSDGTKRKHEAKRNLQPVYFI